MARAMRSWTLQRIVAVSSRSQQRADEFASRYDVARTYASYEGLVEDPEVDAVYVATTHNAHHAAAMAAVEAGKAVLVEKSFTLNAAEAREIQAAAEANGVLVVEAMWPRFGPRFDIVRQLLADGVVGEVVGVQADHSQPLTHVKRLMELELAGGALLDLGIYPVSFASFALGTPTKVAAVGLIGATGVDESVAIHAAGYADHPRAVAALTTTLLSRGPVSATILGTQGRIELDRTSFYAPGPVRLVRTDGTIVESPQQPPWMSNSDGLAHEAAHVAQLVADGATDSPLMPLAESVAIMATLDEVRRQIGLRYPQE